MTTSTLHAIGSALVGAASVALAYRVGGTSAALLTNLTQWSALPMFKRIAPLALFLVIGLSSIGQSPAIDIPSGMVDACLTDESGPEFPPCVWTGDEQGNGEGSSWYWDGTNGVDISHNVARAISR